MLDHVRLGLIWMEDSAKHHSQQASKRADKAIRALRAGKLTGKDILTHVAAFGSSRMQGIRANARNTPFAQPEQTRFKSGMRMHLLTTTAEIVHAGRAMGNCLAEHGLGNKYISLARQGVIKLHVLHDVDGQPVVLLCISTRDNSVMEMKGIHNSRPCKYRPQILHFLARAGVRCDGCRDAVDLVLCDALIQGYADGARDKFVVGDVTYEAASSCLAVRHGSYTALLQKRGMSDLSVTVGTDGNVVEARRRLRSKLQDDLATSARLRTACDAVFGKLDVANKKFWKGDN